MSDAELMIQFEMIYMARANGGYIQLGNAIVKVIDIKPVLQSRGDKIIELDKLDIFGKPVPRQTFKLSDITESVELRLIKVSLK